MKVCRHDVLTELLRLILGMVCDDLELRPTDAALHSLRSAETGLTVGMQTDVRCRDWKRRPSNGKLSCVSPTRLPPLLFDVE